MDALPVRVRGELGAARHSDASWLGLATSSQQREVGHVRPSRCLCSHPPLAPPHTPRPSHRCCSRGGGALGCHEAPLPPLAVWLPHAAVPGGSHHRGRGGLPYRRRRARRRACRLCRSGVAGGGHVLLRDTDVHGAGQLLQQVRAWGRRGGVGGTDQGSFYFFSREAG